MTILEFIDITNKEHLVAVRELLDTGIWPTEFYNRYLSKLEFTTGWQTHLAFKMADAYAYLILKR